MPVELAYTVFAVFLTGGFGLLLAWASFDPLR
jgi:hypothetical protein